MMSDILSFVSRNLKSNEEGHRVNGLLQCHAISAMIKVHTEYEGTSEENPGLRKESKQNQGTGKRDRSVGVSISD